MCTYTYLRWDWIIKIICLQLLILILCFYSFIYIPHAVCLQLPLAKPPSHPIFTFLSELKINSLIFLISKFGTYIWALTTGEGLHRSIKSHGQVPKLSAFGSLVK